MALKQMMSSVFPKDQNEIMESKKVTNWLSIIVN